MTVTNLRAIVAPSRCPSCGSSLVWRTDMLYCESVSCPAKNAKALEHWAKALKIKGLGPATIEKLYIDTVEELYDLDFHFIQEALGSEKLAKKLIDEITASTGAPLEELLPAFGIPLIGKTASNKICKVIETIEDIDAETCRTAGLGPIATKNLLEWWNLFSERYHNLPFTYKVGSRTSRVNITTGVVCISGKLTSFKNKAEATEVLSKLGYTVKDTLTKDVTILVNESGIESAKTKKAVDNGTTIVTNLKEYLGDIV
jgi:DNA ligase (NAD+)